MQQHPISAAAIRIPTDTLARNLASGLGKQATGSARGLRWWLAIVLLLVSGLFPMSPTPSAGAQTQTMPNAALAMSAVQFDDGVRYSLTVIRGRFPMQNVTARITLPAGAEFIEALATDGSTVFRGNQDGILTWQAAGFAADEYIDAFSFRLRNPASAALAAEVAWEGPAAGTLTLRDTPKPIVATAASATVTVGSAGTGTSGLLRAGDTGILIQVAEGMVPDGTQLTLRRLGPDANPPASAGDLWWCAMVELTGLPPDAVASVFTVIRQPLPPVTTTALFLEQDGRWEYLTANGVVTADGQLVGFQHAGGRMAAGTGSKLRGRPQTGVATNTNVTANVSVDVNTPPPPDRLIGNGTGSGNFTVRSFTTDTRAPTPGQNSLQDCINFVIDFNRNAGQNITAATFANARGICIEQGFGGSGAPRSPGGTGEPPAHNAGNGSPVR